MRLSTLRDGTPDGRLLIVSPDATRFASAPVPTLQQLLEQWEAHAATCRDVSDFPDALDPQTLAAPLPRAWQWLDGSAYDSHGALMDQVFGITPERTGLPLMYQGLSDRFYGPFDDVPLPSEELGIDFEGEFGVIVGAVPMGTPAEAALDYVRLVVQINDWSLRALAGLEMKTGFGWVQAKPACAMAGIAVTPDELGDVWRDGRVCADLRVDWNGERFGQPNGAPMAFGFHELIAHAARTRALPAGTIIGSGTVSNANFREVGSTCIAERRGIEIVDEGAARTGFMRFGDLVRMEALLPDGRAPFGVIEQRVVQG
ncbi:fumarylacetoacetate hydrolase family protein [Sphingomonas floccifaciens]|uniref:Fumarylacetoacetate hydrolase family protein n=1 Tax=Sphingomonas floccifaciens TaxID=1844115 RepID=A0ABW4NJ22_9SPHN